MGGTTPYTSTNATYVGSTGILVLTIGTHSLVAGDFVHIDTDSVTFTCTKDANATNHTYPRSSDPANTKWYVKVLDKTTTTITVDVGKSPINETYDHTYVSSTANNVSSTTYNPLIKYTAMTQHTTTVANSDKVAGIYTYPYVNNTTITAQDGQSATLVNTCLLYTSPSPRDLSTSRMPSSA